MKRTQFPNREAAEAYIASLRNNPDWRHADDDSYKHTPDAEILFKRAGIYETEDGVEVVENFEIGCYFEQTDDLWCGCGEGPICDADSVLLWIYADELDNFSLKPRVS